MYGRNEHNIVEQLHSNFWKKWKELSNKEKLPVLDNQEIIHHEECSYIFNKMKSASLIKSDKMQSPELSEAWKLWRSTFLI